MPSVPLFCILFLRQGFCLGCSGTCDPFASTSWVSGITGMWHQDQLWTYFVYMTNNRPGCQENKLHLLFCHFGATCS
jgi:hypothetical protein